MPSPEVVRQQFAFALLLTKCEAIDFNRHKDKKRAKLIRKFVQQAISDSKYLIAGKLPKDIIKKAETS